MSAARRMVCFGVALVGLSSLAPARAPAGAHLAEKVISLSAFSALGTVQQLDPGNGAEMIGLTWFGDQGAQYSVRGFADGAWTEWLDLGDEGGAGPASVRVSSEQHSAGPAWIGHDASLVEIRLDAGAPTSIELHAIDTEPPEAKPTVALGLGPEQADAAVGPPFIISRAGWGADDSWRAVNGPDCVAPWYSSGTYMAVVHHTVNSNSYGANDSAALLRGIYHFHVFTNGWCDIGYNFLVDRYGQIFEGRYGGPHRSVIGAQAGGFNGASTGVALVGDFDSAAVPDAAYRSLVNLLVWKMSYHGIDPLGTATTVVSDSDCACQNWPAGTVVTVPTIVGHRDLNATSCPGRYLYPLIDQLRYDVALALSEPRLKDQRLVCDFNGDGKAELGVYQNGWWYLRGSTTSGAPDAYINYGTSEYTPVCGDWDGNGTETIGVYYNGWWYLRNSTSPGPPDIVVNYGAAGNRPIVGNWNGVTLPGLKGDGIGVFADGYWFLRNTPSPGAPEAAFAYGNAGYTPIAGHWSGGGSRDGIGVVVGGNWYLRTSPSPGGPELAGLGYGLPTDIPVVGDWDGDGIDSAGVARGSYWYLRSGPVAGPFSIVQFSSFAYPF
jgi:hypothetical protein